MQWVWIDTCCIDKRSSTELSEAVNSMYQWYSCAEECYAYLFDVQQPQPIDRSSAADLIPEMFEHSSWFARGWTLQELIAPSHVIFLFANWQVIGCKHPCKDVIFTHGSHSVTRYRLRKGYKPTPASSSAYLANGLYHDLCDATGQPKLNISLAAITGIPEDVLTDKAAIAGKSVAQKMSWASSRQTTKVEDIAYSLLGLFGINMPLLYGEGSRSFRRLQQEIIRVSCDETIFAWQRCFLKPFEDTPLLASHPEEFTNAGHLLRMKAFKRMPYTVTNQGLELRLHAHSKSFSWLGDTDHIIVLLNCSDAAYGFGRGDLARYFSYMHLKRQSCDHYGLVFYGDNANPSQTRLLDRPEWEELSENIVLYVHTSASSATELVCG